MKKVIKLNEKDLQRIVKRTIKEEMSDEEINKEYAVADDYASDLRFKMEDEIRHYLELCLNNMDIEGIILHYQNEFRNRYGKFLNGEDIFNEFIDSLMGIKAERGFNYEDLSYAMMECFIDRLYEQSEHNNPDELTNFNL